MLISCLLPTFNRFPDLNYLVNEAVQCFLLQDYSDKELIICNDAPGQTLTINHPQICVFNRGERFRSLGEKLDWMIKQCQGEYICRWDDDDLSLPWRLEMSYNRLIAADGLKKEWRPENHWYMTPTEIKETKHPGNTHIMAIWHRDILGGITYPGEPCPSGLEDQTFTSALRKRGYPFTGDLLAPQDIFYIYRWGTGSNHLSGKGGGARMQQNYEEIGEQPIFHRTYLITPSWREDYLAKAKQAALMTR